MGGFLLGVVIGAFLFSIYMWFLWYTGSIIFTKMDEARQRTVDEILIEQRERLNQEQTKAIKDKQFYTEQVKKVTAIVEENKNLKRFVYKEVIERLMFQPCVYEDNNMRFNVLYAWIDMNPDYGIKAYIPVVKKYDGLDVLGSYAWLYFDEEENMYEFLAEHGMVRTGAKENNITGVNVNDAIRNINSLHSLYIAEP